MFFKARSLRNGLFLCARGHVETVASNRMRDVESQSVHARFNPAKAGFLSDLHGAERHEGGMWGVLIAVWLSKRVLTLYA